MKHLHNSAETLPIFGKPPPRSYRPAKTFDQLHPDRRVKWAAFPLLKRSYKRWVREIAQAMRDEVAGRSDAWSGSVRKRATAMELCVTAVVGHVCESCGTPADGGARLHGAGNPCQSRSCPRCARRRALSHAEWGGRIFEHVEAHHSREGWGWKLLTITAKRDQSDPDDHTVDALRARALGLWAAFRAVRLHLPRGAGAWAALENSAREGITDGVEHGSGNIHMHAVLYAPFLDKSDIWAWCVKGWGACGWPEIRSMELDKDGKQLEGEARREHVTDGIREALKYTVKSPGGIDGGWLAGVPKLLAHPTVAARWELATWGMRICERYGVFREVPRLDEDAAEQLDARSHDEDGCSSCGSCGSWREVHTSVRAWVRECAWHGVQPFGRPRSTNAELAASQERQKVKKWPKTQQLVGMLVDHVKSHQSRPRLGRRWEEWDPERDKENPTARAKLVALGRLTMRGQVALPIPSPPPKDRAGRLARRT